jgi:hypothetical protein
LFAEVFHLPVMVPAGTGRQKMLKTALALACLCAATVAAPAFETQKYDAKIERAAIAQVGKKMGALRETVELELPVAATEIPVASNLDETAGIPEPHTMQAPAAPKMFRIVAGNYQ